MDSPFFTNRRGYQQPDMFGRRLYPSPSSRGVPIYQANQTPDAHRAAERVSSAPKVVRIPVHFVGSEKVDRSGSATKIQKILRGFLVRNNLRKIKDIKVHVDEIEERLKRSGVVDLVRRDAKERLRMNESLMALLIKLDSISGVDFGVRVSRKAVIGKAIALQERIDAIAASDLDGEENGETIDVETDARIPPVHSKVSRASGGSSEWSDFNVEGGERAVEGDGNENDEIIDLDTEARVPPMNSKDSCADSGNSEGSECCVKGGERTVEVESSDDEIGIIDVGVDCEVKESKGGAENLDFVAEGSEMGKDGKGANDGKTNRELLEKMMEENEKMMRMMSELVERNELQSSTMGALSRRVELLEKAFLRDMLRRTKAKAAATHTT